mmetsp:Transcript_17439/g.41387  ORF Transcript_17439/g.41387 Transcript_17439/m.41387 type:complete len:272 (+) Transcript_17439:3079-3894(+)
MALRLQMHRLDARSQVARHLGRQAQQPQARLLHHLQVLRVHQGHIAEKLVRPRHVLLLCAPRPGLCQGIVLEHLRSAPEGISGELVQKQDQSAPALPAGSPRADLGGFHSVPAAANQRAVALQDAAVRGAGPLQRGRWVNAPPPEPGAELVGRLPKPELQDLLGRGALGPAPPRQPSAEGQAAGHQPTCCLRHQCRLCFFRWLGCSGLLRLLLLLPGIVGLPDAAPQRLRQVRALEHIPRRVARALQVPLREKALQLGLLQASAQHLQVSC